MSYAPDAGARAAPRRARDARDAVSAQTSRPVREKDAREARLARMRDPRPGEAELIASLRDEPRRVVDGPLGLCTKRGWVRVAGRSPCGDAIYEATRAGIAAADRTLAAVGAGRAAR